MPILLGKDSKRKKVLNYETVSALGLLEAAQFRLTTKRWAAVGVSIVHSPTWPSCEITSREIFRTKAHFLTSSAKLHGHFPCWVVWQLFFQAPGGCGGKFSRNLPASSAAISPLCCLLPFFLLFGNNKSFWTTELCFSLHSTLCLASLFPFFLTADIFKLFYCCSIIVVHWIFLKHYTIYYFSIIFHCIFLLPFF